MDLPAIDWLQPWLAPYRRTGERVCAALARGGGVAGALNVQAVQAGEAAPRLAAGPLSFVAAQALPAGEAYEAFIARTAQVPTRDTLHDLFNGLVWLSFPRLKRRLNEMQAEQIECHGIGPTRGAVRDALTVFDENGVMLQAPQMLLDDLRQRRWHDLFVTQRARWQEASVTLFGHALMEKLLQPRKDLTAHAWAVPAGEAAEPFLAAQVHAGWLAGKPAMPLPVLGVPGWWPANEDAVFYRDERVFRPLPSGEPSGRPAGAADAVEPRHPVAPWPALFWPSL